MPLMGYLTGSLFSDFMNRYSSIIIFLILGFIGGKMIWDGFHEEGEENTPSKNLTYKMLFFQAIATSIDALAVGISFAAVSANIWLSAGLIGVITFSLSYLGVFFGKRLSCAFQKKAVVTGGVVLILIGAKILLEHLGILG